MEIVRYNASIIKQGGTRVKKKRKWLRCMVLLAVAALLVLGFLKLS